MIRILFAIFLTLTSYAAAEEVVLGMDADKVSITANFDGSKILLFGAIKREEPIPAGPLGVIVTVAGPDERVNVRRKERKFGIWVNTDQILVDAAPSFYSVSTSAPWKQIISDTEDLRHKISIPRAIRAVDTKVSDTKVFNDALIRVRKKNGSYGVHEFGVRLDKDTLFQTTIPMPANLTEGDYKTRIFLTRNGKVISETKTVIHVKKVGLEDFLNKLAHQQAFLYALLSLVIAVLAGWGASTFFKMLRAH